MKKPQQRYSLNKNKYLLPNELEHLERVLSENLESDTRNALLLILALKTGGRAQEILNLKKSNLNTFDETVLIHGLKGSNDREIPLPSPLFKKLLNYSNGLSHDELFPVTYNRFRQIWDLYRPAPKKLHSLRHTFAIQLYRKTKD